MPKMKVKQGKEPWGDPYFYTEDEYNPIEKITRWFKSKIAMYRIIHHIRKFNRNPRYRRKIMMEVLRKVGMLQKEDS